MSETYDQDIEEDFQSSVKEESNQYSEDFQSQSSKSNNDKKDDKKIEIQNKKPKSKSSSSSSSKSKNDNYDDYDDEFDEEEEITQQIKAEIQLKPTKSQIAQQNEQQQKQQITQERRKSDNGVDKDQSMKNNDKLSNTLKSSIDDDQLKKQQLSFIDNLNKFVKNKESQQPSQPDHHKSKDVNELRNSSNSTKPPIPSKQNFIRDQLFEKPKKKPDIESVPNDDEIEEIIKKNQQNFLQMINNKQQKISPSKQYIQDPLNQGDYDESSQYEQDEDEQDDLHVIYETDREDSQAGKTSHNESYDNQYYSISTDNYGNSVYQQYSYYPEGEEIDEGDEDQYYESTAKKTSPKKYRKQTQKEYERIIYEKQMELKQLYEIKQLKDNLNLNVDENDDQNVKIARKAKLKEKEIQYIRLMQDRMRYGCKKCAEANPQKDREALREENEHLRRVINEQGAQIKLLKVQLRKTGDRALDNSFSSNGSISTSFQRKLEQLEDDKEKLKQENLSLRKQLKDVKIVSQSQLNRQQKLNIEIQKALGSDIRSLQEKEFKKPVDTKMEQQFKLTQERLAELRLDLEKMIKKYEDQKLKIKEKDEQIITLKSKVQGRHFAKQMEKIDELQAVVDNYEIDKEKIRDDMQLDKQLELIFPHSIIKICYFFNLCIALEEAKRGKYLRLVKFLDKETRPIINRFKNAYYLLKDQIKFFFTKKPIHHPKQQEIIRATIKAWNESPDIVARQIRSQQKELKELRIKYIEMDNEIEELKNRNEQLEKDVELLRQRNSVVETRLQTDKNKLINNVIIQLKYHAVEDEEQDYLLELKKLINTIKEGPPILISQAEKDEFKRQQELEAQKQRKKKEREERKQQMLLRKQQKLEEKREQEEKEKEELLKQKNANRVANSLRYKQNNAIQQTKETRPSSGLVNSKKTPTQNSLSIKQTPRSIKSKDEENVTKENEQDINNKTKDNKNFRVSNITNKLQKSVSNVSNTSNNTNS